jgi:hypothetical protein
VPFPEHALATVCWAQAESDSIIVTQSASVAGNPAAEISSGVWQA